MAERKCTISYDDGDVRFFVATNSGGREFKKTATVFGFNPNLVKDEQNHVIGTEVVLKDGEYASDLRSIVETRTNLQIEHV